MSKTKPTTQKFCVFEVHIPVKNFNEHVQALAELQKMLRIKRSWTCGHERNLELPLEEDTNVETK